jgi:hypothetical protein
VSGSEAKLVFGKKKNLLPENSLNRGFYNLGMKVFRRIFTKKRVEPESMVKTFTVWHLEKEIYLRMFLYLVN